MSVPERAKPREGWTVSRINYLTSTTFALPGYRVVENLGVVRGVVVRSRSIVGTGLAAFQTVFGGNISLFTELCERTRADAFDLMVRHAIDAGANAVLGVRYDATDIMRGVTEVLCYGTAVVVEEENTGKRP
jgi:uncharacterized protein YbjQ (UPF0145 family)